MLRDYEREIAAPKPRPAVVRGYVSASTPFDYSGYREGIRKAIDNPTPQYMPPTQTQFVPPEGYEQALAAHRAAYTLQEQAQQNYLNYVFNNQLANQQHQETEK